MTSQFASRAIESGSAAKLWVARIRAERRSGERETLMPPIERGSFAQFTLRFATSALRSNGSLMSHRWLSCIVALFAGTMPSTADEATIFTGCCDASAAVAVDDQHFVVADDEDKILRVYRREGGGAVIQIDLGSFLGSKKEEADLEGGAMVGDMVY